MKLYTAEEARNKALKKSNYKLIIENDDNVKFSVENLLAYINYGIEKNAERGYLSLNISKNNIEDFGPFEVNGRENDGMIRWHIDFLINKLDLYSLLQDEFGPRGFKITFKQSREINNKNWHIIIDWSE